MGKKAKHRKPTMWDMEKQIWAWRIQRWMDSLRGIIYDNGWRPKPESIFFSPSRDLMCRLEDLDLPAAFRRGVEEAELHLKMLELTPKER